MRHTDWPMLISGIVLGFIAMGWWASLWYVASECPRMIYGYRCNGSNCDHSPEAVAEAERAMGILN